MLEHQVSIDTLNADPGTVRPSILARILHPEGVNVIGRAVKTDLESTFCIVFEEGGCIELGGSRENGERLLRGIRLGYLSNLGVYLVIRTDKALNCINYN